LHLKTYSSSTMSRVLVLNWCLGLGALSQVAAAEGDQAEADQVVVTSTAGEARDPLTTPVAVHVVDQTQAESNRGPWIGDSLNQVPGVYQTRLRGVVDVPTIRMPQSFKNHYLFLQDGVPLQSTVMFNSKALLYSAATTSPGGIEVLKGPGTALYGSDAMAAVIDVHSRAPRADPGVQARLGGGMYGGRSLRTEVTGAITDQQQASVAIGYDGEDGWRDHSAWDRLQGIARHRLLLGDAIIDTSLLVTGFRSEMTGQLSPTVYENDPEDDGLAPAVPLDEATDDATYIRLASAIRAPLGQEVWLEVTPYLRAIDNTYLEVFNPATTPQDREKTASAGSLNRLRLRPWQDGELLIGTDVEWTRLDFTVDQSRPTAVVGGFNSYQGPHYDFTVDHLTVAPWLQLTQRFGRRWIVDLGLRFDWARYDYDEHLGPTSDPQDLVWRPPDSVDTFHQLSPKAGVTYLLTPEQALFARYAHGFRLPAADALYVLGNGQQAFALDPEQVDAYEIGWKGRTAELSWEIDAYWSDAYDGIVEDVVTPGGTISTNGGRRWYRGIEVGGTWQIIAPVDIGVAYAHTWHHIVRYRSDGDSPQDGQVPAKAPANLANLRLGVEPLSNVRLEAELQWLGRWWMDDLNTARTPDEWLFGVRVAWYIDRHWMIDAAVVNLFDNAYAATAERFAFGDRYRPGQPFTASAGVTWRY
jgi:iron complex outermembrane receptor protein